MDLKVLNRHVKLAGEGLRALVVFEVEGGAHGRVEKLVEAVRVVEWGSLLVVEFLGTLHHLLVGKLPLVRHVLQAVLTAGLGAPEDHDVVAARRDTHQDVLFIFHFWVDDFEAFEGGPHCLGHLVWGIILSVDETVPALKALDVGDSRNFSSVVRVVLQVISLILFWRESLGCLLEGSH